MVCFEATFFGATPAVKKILARHDYPVSRKLHETAGCRRQHLSGSTKLVFKLAPPPKIQIPDLKITKSVETASTGIAAWQFIYESI